MIQYEGLPGSLVNASTTLIEYPQFQELHGEIIRCHSKTKAMGEPQCMSLEGVTGAGKTRLVTAYAEQFPRSEVETDSGTDTLIPVFYVRVPSPVTIKDLAQKVLKTMQDPAYEKGSRASMTDRIIGFSKDCHIELFIYDDFHHLIHSETDHILAEVSDWLKTLIKDTGVAHLVVGTEGKVRKILKANKELSRLFAARKTLHPFRWDWNDEVTINDFSRFVEYAEEVVERPLTKEIERTELLYRIHYATDGVVGLLMALMYDATTFAEEEGRSLLDLVTLSRAFQERLLEYFDDGRVNPFDEEVGAEFFAPKSPSSDNAQEGNKKGQRGKKHKASVAETLTTR